MLEKIAGYNDLSTPLRERLEKAKKEAGATVRYKFSIARKNPDPEKFNGEQIYPSMFTLGPVTFSIVDPYEKGVLKKIGLVDQVNEKGEAISFRRLQIKEAQSGEVALRLDHNEDAEMFAMLELHPKNGAGDFRDKTIQPLFYRIDELKEAEKSYRERNLRADAMWVAVNMRDEEIRDFAAAMNWDENSDLTILRDKVLEIADKNPDQYRQFVDTKNIEYRSTIKRAIGSNVISWIPVESKFVWTGNGQTIAVIDKGEGVDPFDRMSDWFIASKNGPEVYKKIRAILSGKEKVV